METIKRKDGSLRFREMIWINGKAVKSPCFKRKSDVKIWKSRIESEKYFYKANDRHSNVSLKKTFDEFFVEWLQGKTHSSLKTLSNYQLIHKKHFSPFIGQLPLKNIGKEHVNALIERLRHGHNSKGINIIVALLKSVLKGARKQRYLSHDPLEDVKMMPEDPRNDIYWTEAEIGQFLRACSFDPMLALYKVALNTGMRRGELCGLCWDRIDFHSNLITVTRTRDRLGLKETTKTKLKRVIPMNAGLRSLLLELMREQRNPIYVFVDKDGAPIDPTHLYRVFGKAQRKAGFKSTIRFHDLRHTFASQYMMKKGNIYDLQRILGHSKTEMTQRYSHLSPDHLRQGMMIMDFGLEKYEPNQDLTTDVLSFKKV